MFDTLCIELANRGFIGINNICSMRHCHKDNKHFLLLTDGIIIYSNIPYYSDAKHYPDSVVQEWYFDDFKIEDLDAILALYE
jgi:hypothetical protein